MSSTPRFALRLAFLECLRICLDLLPVVGAVVGGSNAAPGEFPHMALLGRPESPSNGGYHLEWTCGGSLISNRFVLTAAHCAHLGMRNPPTVVRLGEHDLGEGPGMAKRSPKQDYAIRRIVAHPAYRGLYNDIALVQLARTVSFDRFIQPACLWTEDAIPEDVPVIATGWGNIGHFDEPATILQRVQIPVVPNDQCNRLLHRNRWLSNGVLPKQLCAGDPLGGKDTCAGDSGGPLQLVSSNETPIGLCRYQLVGVTSNGCICGTANRPGIYTRISSYVDWIERMVWGKKDSNY